MICYLVTNRLNGKRYIGATKYNAAHRWKGHVKGAREDSKSLLARAIRKYGVEAFDIETIACAINWKDLGATEQALIADRQPEYNLTAGGDGVKPYSEDLRSRISAAALARFQTEDGKAFLRLNGEQTKQRWKDPAYRKRHLAAWKKVVWDGISDEEYNKRSAKLRQMAAANKARAEVRKRNCKYVRSEEFRANCRAKMQERIKTEEFKQTIKKAVAARKANRIKKLAVHSGVSTYG